MLSAWSNTSVKPAMPGSFIPCLEIILIRDSSPSMTLEPLNIQEKWWKILHDWPHLDCLLPSSKCLIGIVSTKMIMRALCIISSSQASKATLLLLDVTFFLDFLASQDGLVTMLLAKRSSTTFLRGMVFYFLPIHDIMLQKVRSFTCLFYKHSFTHT